MSDNVKAIIMAAGKGTRMRSELPKVLHKIYDKPLLDYIIESAKNTGLVDGFFVIVGHQAELVEQHVTGKFNDARCVLQSPQLGTGDAVSKALPYLSEYKGQVLILNGDIPLIQPDTLKEFVEEHRNNERSLTVMSAIFDEPGSLGRVIRNANDEIEAIVEAKDATDIQRAVKEINTGIYCVNWGEISPALKELKCNNAQGEYYITDIVSWAINKGLKTGCYVLKDEQESFGINSKSDLAIAVKALSTRILTGHMDNGVEIVDPDTTYISQDTTIKPGTVIYPCTYINGKNAIGKDCKIGPFAHIRGDVTLGDNVKVGNFVELKKTIVKSNTNISHLSYVGDSEVGEGVNIGAGTITANYNALTKVKSKTVIQDGVSVGSNSVLVAPVEIGECSSVAAGTVVSKDTPPFSLAITRAPIRFIENWVKSKFKK